MAIETLFPLLVVGPDLLALSALAAAAASLRPSPSGRRSPAEPARSPLYVDMAGEGYDCPDIAVVGYATNTRTPL